jgi:DNA repair protein RecO
MKYKKLTGIILKKQNYKEADQIVTIWTRELGKVRFLAKSLRAAKSKLVYVLPDLGLVEIQVAGERMPTVVSGRILKNYRNVREDLKKTAIAFYCTEVMLKMTADEQANLEAFNLLVSFLDHLDSASKFNTQYYLPLQVFSLKLLASLGFAPLPERSSFRVPANLGPHLNAIQTASFDGCPQLAIDSKTAGQLHQLINKFMEYLLERHIKSEIFLTKNLI